MESLQVEGGYTSYEVEITVFKKEAKIPILKGTACSSSEKQLLFCWTTN
jgi:hypothetical protein